MVRFIIVPDAAWRDFLAEKGIKPWYSKLYLPGAFTHTDGDGVPDEQDIIWLAAYVHRALQRDEGWAWDLLIHEVMHNMVPKVDGVPDQVLAERLSHPKAMLPSLLHSIRTGHKTNSFSRVLRWFDGPDPEYHKARNFVAIALAKNLFEPYSHPQPASPSI